MDKTVIISRVRVEVRKKRADLRKERLTLRWIQQFFRDMSIHHSSQIRLWQQEAFLSKLKKDPELSRNDVLQARSALLILNRVVFGINAGTISSQEVDSEPGVFKITA